MLQPPCRQDAESGLCRCVTVPRLPRHDWVAHQGQRTETGSMSAAGQQPPGSLWKERGADYEWVQMGTDGACVLGNQLGLRPRGQGSLAKTPSGTVPRQGRNGARSCTVHVSAAACRGGGLKIATPPDTPDRGSFPGTRQHVPRTPSRVVRVHYSGNASQLFGQVSTFIQAGLVQAQNDTWTRCCDPIVADQQANQRRVACPRVSSAFRFT
ncbi:hypothetical protein F5Y12DRAFT_710309 [Xylaria sp. FL1777]|nr:hypothetical protein F5Y12DRAFT_710309 [Xylaria sp. FL1777]